MASNIGSPQHQANVSDPNTLSAPIQEKEGLEGTQGPKKVDVPGVHADAAMATNVNAQSVSIPKETPPTDITAAQDHHPVGADHKVDSHKAPQGPVESNTSAQSEKIATDIPASGGSSPAPSPAVKREYQPPPASIREKAGGLGPSAMGKNPFHITQTQLHQFTGIQKEIEALKGLNPKPEGTDERITAKETRLAQIQSQLRPTIAKFIQQPTEFGKFIDADPEGALDLIDTLGESATARELISNLMNVMSSKPGHAEPGKVSQETVGKMMNLHIHREAQNERDPAMFLRSNMNPVGMMRKEFQQKLLAPVISEPLDKTITKNVTKKKAGALGEADPAVLTRPTSVDSKKATKSTLNILKDLENISADRPIPPALKSYYQTVYKESKQKWGPQTKSTMHVNSQFMLAGVTPTIQSGSESTNYGHITYVDEDKVNATIISQLLQAVSNNSAPRGNTYKDIPEGFFDAQQNTIDRIVFNLMK